MKKISIVTDITTLDQGLKNFYVNRYKYTSNLLIVICKEGSILKPIKIKL